MTDNEEYGEPFCFTCNGTIGIFIGHEGWHHFRGNGTEQSPNVLFDAGHEPVVAWSENLSKKSSDFSSLSLAYRTSFR